tara:strand:+ start:125 stop:478 length:354 start_codon:yes stop_codon:yes gene_type:complete
MKTLIIFVMLMFISCKKDVYYVPCKIVSLSLHSDDGYAIGKVVVFNEDDYDGDTIVAHVRVPALIGDIAHVEYTKTEGGGWCMVVNFPWQLRKSYQLIDYKEINNKEFEDANEDVMY